MKIFAETEKFKFEYTLVETEEGLRLKKGGQLLDVHIRDLGEGRYCLIKDNMPYIVNVHRTNEHYNVRIAGSHFQVMVEDERTRRVKELVRASAGARGEKTIKAPIPGLIVKTPAQAGDTVREGEPLIILEAMKMENIIKAPFECRVVALSVKEGDTVEQNKVMMKIKGIED